MPIETHLPADLQLIVPNLHRRYSGVTATNRMVAPRLATHIGAAWLGPDAPPGIAKLTFGDLMRLRRRGERAKPRIWHARRNNEMLVERATELPAGILRVMVLMKDESRWSVISFFDSEEAAAAAEERFEQMGDEIPESVRGKRISLESFEVAFDVEMVR